MGISPSTDFGPRADGAEAEKVKNALPLFVFNKNKSARKTYFACLALLPW